MSIPLGSLPRRALASVRSLTPGVFLATACVGYVAGGESPLFLSGRLVDPNGNPVHHCQVGVEHEGHVDDWRRIDGEFREVFLLSTRGPEHPIVIQCRGYFDQRLVAVPLPTGGWDVSGTRVGVNATVHLGELMLEPR